MEKECRPHLALWGVWEELPERRHQRAGCQVGPERECGLQRAENRGSEFDMEREFQRNREYSQSGRERSLTLDKKPKADRRKDTVGIEVGSASGTGPCMGT